MTIANATQIRSKATLTLLDKYTCAILLLQSLFFFNSELTRLSLWILMPIAFIGYFIKTNSIAFNPYLKILFVIFAWCSVTYFAADNTAAAQTELVRIWGVYLYCYVFSALSRNVKCRNILFCCYVFIFINCCIYAYENILSLSGDILLDNNQRLGDEKLNANIFGYFLIFMTFILYSAENTTDILLIKRISRILFILLIPLSFYIAILTASRQILILEIPFISLLLAKRYISRFNLKSLLIILAICVGAAFLYLEYGEGLYEDSYLKTRSEVNVGDDPRMQLLNGAINVGLENPIFGVGPGNFRYHVPENVFSHNSFAELFANNGIFAALLFAFLLCNFAYKKLKAWRIDKSNMNYSLLLVSIFYIIDNFFYVMYLSTWLMGFFFILTNIKSNSIKNITKLKTI